MKARSVARELALFTLFQLDQKEGAVQWSKLSLEDMVVNTVRTLRDLAHEQIEAAVNYLSDLRESMVEYELSHPANETIPVDLPTQPVPIPTTEEMRQRIDTLLESFGNLEEAFYLPEVNALANREDVRNFALRLVRAVLNNKQALDSLIDEHSRNWRVERLQKMDRTLLRLALAELKYTDNVDPATVVGDALALAHQFTSEESRKFIHGILGAVSGVTTEEEGALDHV